MVSADLLVQLPTAKYGFFNDRYDLYVQDYILYCSDRHLMLCYPKIGKHQKRVYLIRGFGLFRICIGTFAL